MICLHSFSKNFGATGNRLGFVAVHHDNVMDELLAAQPAAIHRQLQDRYRSITSDVAGLPFLARLVADSREVALHNIAGLATPDQVQMALFALAYLLPSGATYVAGDARRAGGAARRPARPARRPRAGRPGQHVLRARRRPAGRRRRSAASASPRGSATHVAPADVPLRLAREHGVVVLPGQIFDAESWDVRVSLASLTTAELTAVADALVTVLRSYDA